MITKLHTCHPYLSPAQLTKQDSLDVKTDWEGRKQDRNLGRVKKSCLSISSFFFFFFLILSYLLNKLLCEPKIKHLLNHINHRKFIRKHSVPLDTAMWQIKFYWSTFPPGKTMDLHSPYLRDNCAWQWWRLSPSFLKLSCNDSQRVPPSWSSLGSSWLCFVFSQFYEVVIDI